MDCQVKLDVKDIFNSIRSNAKDDCVTLGFLERLCGGDLEMVNSFVDDGFLMKGKEDRYYLTRKLLNDSHYMRTPGEYRDLVQQQWFKLSTFI